MLRLGRVLSCALACPATLLLGTVVLPRIMLIPMLVGTLLIPMSLDKSLECGGITSLGAWACAIAVVLRNGSHVMGPKADGLANKLI